jgi:integrase
MARIVNKLTHAFVSSTTREGHFADGRDGLYLQCAKINGSLTKSWVLRFQIAGKKREMGGGPIRNRTLAEARDWARRMRQIILDGGDPIEQRKAKRSALKSGSLKSLTVAEACKGYITDNAKKWTSLIHARQWRQSLDDYVIPTLGSLLVADIEQAHVIAAFKPIWTTKTQTASRTLERLKLVIDWAVAHGHRLPGVNPAQWKGVLSAVLPAPSSVAPVKHHVAIPYSDVPAFARKLREREGSAARALELILLTASRASEAIEARWSEINLKAGLWTVPASRMKGRKPHTVPLSGRAIEILRGLPREATDVVFASPKLAGRAVSAVAVRNLLAELAGKEVTLHGTARSSFRDWVGDCTSFPREIAEAALAHKVGDSVEAAYRRGSAIAKRRDLMEAWAGFCAGSGTADVPPLKREGARQAAV